MSLHINRFVDNIKAHESRGQKDFVMSMRDAKDLHSDITKLLLTLEQLHNKTPGAQKDEVITIELTGGGFKST
jgi:hypothetical protein